MSIRLLIAEVVEPSGLRAACGGLDAFHENGDELVTFLQKRCEAAFGAHGFALDDLEADEGFPELFETHFHLVNKVAARLGTLGFSIIQGG